MTQPGTLQKAPKRQPQKSVSPGCSVPLAAFGLICTGSMIAKALEADGDVVSDLIGAAVFGVAPLMTGVTLLLRRAAHQKRDALQQREERILRAAQAHGGLLTPAIVALDGSLTLEEARDQLETMVRQGDAEILPMDDGTIRFAITGIAEHETKQLIS